MKRRMAAGGLRSACAQWTHNERRPLYRLWENAAGVGRVELFKLAVAIDGSFSSASRRKMKKRFVVFGILLAVALRPWPGSGTEREWHAENGFRWAELEIPKTGKTGFTLLPPDQTGIYFTNALSEWEG